MAAADGVRGRAPGLVSAFMAAPTKRFSPSLPESVACAGRAHLLLLFLFYFYIYLLQLESRKTAFFTTEAVCAEP
jgi:hypothetical protein